MAVTVSYFNKFIEAVGTGGINLGTDLFKLVLVNNYAFSGADEEYDDISADELDAGNGYTTTGVNITGTTFAFTGTNTKWDADNVTITAAGGAIGPADGAIIFDATTLKLVCYIDFGQEETADDGTDFKFTFNANGIFVIAPI